MSALLHEAAALYPVLTTNGRDYLAWARRIIYRHQRKDADLLHVQVQFAYQALNMAPPKDTP